MELKEAFGLVPNLAYVVTLLRAGAREAQLLPRRARRHGRAPTSRCEQGDRRDKQEELPRRHRDRRVAARPWSPLSPPSNWAAATTASMRAPGHHRRAGHHAGRRPEAIAAP